MATRSRTLLFLQFRNSYAGSHAAALRQQYTQQQQQLQQQHALSDGFDNGNERIGLMDSAETTIELMMLPPKWVDVVDEVNEELDRIRANIQRLEALHKKHLLPGFDDRIQEERDIERLTDEITAVSVRGVELRNKDLYNMNPETSLVDATDMEQGFTSSQQAFAEQSHAAITQREQEINHIAKSIFQLADIFKDLQTMVIDQGTLLDRIDYNVEQTKSHMQDAVLELEEGEKYQKQARKRKIMLLLILIIVGLIIILIFKPKRSSAAPPTEAKPIDRPPDKTIGKLINPPGAVPPIDPPH
ncbi:hypothetical protein BGZ73_002682 [Actinomortierella ambigua]|nr:hypothetical protein BGZ73_002682 [Actinomortierella ambigua]